MSRKDHQGISDLRKASVRRLADAEKLLAQGSMHVHCAMYIAGYAIERKLKAIAMEIHRCATLAELAMKWRVDEREVYTHGLECFVKRLTLYSRFTESGEVWKCFTGQVSKWRPSWRYAPGRVDRTAVDAAQSFLVAVKTVHDWLEANRG